MMRIEQLPGEYFSRNVTERVTDREYYEARNRLVQNCRLHVPVGPLGLVMPLSTDEGEEFDSLWEPEDPRYRIYVETDMYNHTECLLYMELFPDTLSVSLVSDIQHALRDSGPDWAAVVRNFPEPYRMLIETDRILIDGFSDAAYDNLEVLIREAKERLDWPEHLIPDRLGPSRDGEPIVIRPFSAHVIRPFADCKLRTLYDYHGLRNRLVRTCRPHGPIGPRGVSNTTWPHDEWIKHPMWQPAEPDFRIHISMEPRESGERLIDIQVAPEVFSAHLIRDIQDAMKVMDAGVSVCNIRDRLLIICKDVVLIQGFSDQAVNDKDILIKETKRLLTWVV